MVLAFAVPPHLQQRMLVWFVTVGVWGLVAQLAAIAVRLGWTAPAIPPNFRLTVVTALLVVPLVLHVETTYAPPYWVHAALWVPLTIALSVGLLQPVKGAVVALQWFAGMHGFDEAKKLRDAASASRGG